MTGKALPDDDHISRYCKPSDIEDGFPVPTAFLPRVQEEYLSVNWLEYLKEPNDQDLSAAVDRVRKNFTEKGILKLGKNGRIVQLNAGSIRNHLPGQLQIDIIHQPTKEDKSHSGIFGYGTEERNRLIWESCSKISRTT